MDTDVPLSALLQKIDAVLLSQGTDPASISDTDKIMLAVQYVEIAFSRGLTVAAHLEMYRL
jgi:hypothetical protein